MASSLQIPPLPDGNSKKKWLRDDGTPHEDEVLAVWADEAHFKMHVATLTLKKLNKQGQRTRVHKIAEQVWLSFVSDMQIGNKFVTPCCALHVTGTQAQDA